MSDHVIITGVRRAREIVSISEIKQMCGRIGRKQNGLSYSADIILNDDDYQIENDLKGVESYDAISCLNSIQKFSFYLLPEIVKGNVRNKTEIESFYSRTLCGYQGNKLDIDKVIEYLLKNEALAMLNSNFYILENGKIASSFYMSVGDVKCLKDNFTRVIDSNDRDRDGALAWALGNLETIKIHGDFGDHREEINRFKSDLGDYDCEDGCVITSALWWCMLGNGVPGKQMANNVRQLRKHFGRIKLVLVQLGFDSSFCDELEIRIRRNISRELLPFFTDPNMTKHRACTLKWMGYDNAIGTENVELEGEE